jgi:rRNA-processing protein FCF1
MFLLNECFPDAAALLSHRYVPLAECKNTCLVTLDTNVLIAPYRIGSKSLAEIESAYKMLLGQNRLFIIGHCVREFSRLKGQMLAELAKAIQDESNRAIAPIKHVSEILRGLPAYDGAVEASSSISAAIKEARKKVDEVLATIQSWQSDDPVSRLYRDLFSGGVVEDFTPDTEEQKKLAVEWKHRVENQIPPGYKDDKKEDNAEGDFLIWKTILKVGAEKQRHMVFVTGEEKADWWIRSGKVPYFPRLELMDEYRRASNGCTFYMLNFPRFLETFGVSTTVVHEVEKLDEAIQRELRKRQSTLNDATKKMIAEVYNLERLVNMRDALISDIESSNSSVSELLRIHGDSSSLSLPWSRTIAGLRSHIAKAEEKLLQINEAIHFMTTPTEENALTRAGDR